MVNSQIDQPHCLVSLKVMTLGSLMHQLKHSSYQLHHHSKPFREPIVCTVIIPFKTIHLNGFIWCINLFQKGTDCRRVKARSHCSANKNDHDAKRTHSIDWMSVSYSASSNLTNRMRSLCDVIIIVFVIAAV